MNLAVSISSLPTTALELSPSAWPPCSHHLSRLIPSVTRQFGGLGLGLAISKHLVELHHGTIEAESRGRSFGATFRVILDTQPESARRSNRAFRALKYPPEPLRILLVEDHRDTRHTLSRLLTHFGHEVLTADNVRSALKIIRSGE